MEAIVVVFVPNKKKRKTSEKKSYGDDVTTCDLHRSGHSKVSQFRNAIGIH